MPTKVEGINSDNYGNQKISMSPPAGSRVDVLSVDWCDKTTWWPESSRIENETLSDSGDGLTFNSVNPFWICTTRGRITGEDHLNGDYVPVVKANGVEQQEDEPFGGDTHDFSVNYEDGSVTFHEEPATPIVATYSKANGSNTVIKPKENKIIRLTKVEVQFSQDIVLTDAITFQAWGYVDVFAPELLTTADPPGPYPPGTLIPINNATIYKTMLDYINEAAGSYPVIPAMGGSNRGTSQPIHIYRWPYADRASTDLIASYGMEIRCGLQNNIPFEGEHAVATFYGISLDEQSSG